MADDPLDNLDRRILHLLQLDARGATDTDIAAETDVTGTTIHNRIQRLEDEGVIVGYNPEINYERAGYPMRVLFICSTDLSRRSEMAQKVLEVRGVVNVREMLAGEENLHVEVVAEATSDVKESTEQLDDLGLRIVSSNILAEERIQPWNHFHQEVPQGGPDTLSDVTGDASSEYGADESPDGAGDEPSDGAGDESAGDVGDDFSGDVADESSDGNRGESADGTGDDSADGGAGET